MSFSVVREQGGLMVRNFAFRPGGCVGAGAFALPMLSAVGPSGTFGQNRGFPGTVGSNRGRLVYAFDGVVAGRRCHVRLRIPLVPGRRRTVRDGRWTGQSTLGDPVSMTVSLGGRLVSWQGRTTLDICGEAPPRAYPTAGVSGIFVSPLGAFRAPLDYSVHFTDTRSASGSYAIRGACAHRTPVSLHWIKG